MALSRSVTISIPSLSNLDFNAIRFYDSTKHITITDSHNGSNNKQKASGNRTTALERTAA